jgi:general secretion pathway protein I
VPTPPLRCEGFTLLEVLVALAVLAVALAAAIKAGSENTANAAYLRDRTHAHWVAMNTVADWQLRGAWPHAGTSTGYATLSGREWRWSATVRNTPDASVRRVDVRVAPREGGEPLATLTAFLGDPGMQADRQ